MYQTDEAKPVGVYVPENNVLLSPGDYEEFAVNQINIWGLYCAWINFTVHLGKKKSTVYSQGLKKTRGKRFRIYRKEGQRTRCTPFRTKCSNAQHNKHSIVPST